MDEALAGHADWIDVSMQADGFVTVIDNGRGMPVDPHPKFPKKSALEVIMCTLHAGGKVRLQGLRDLGRPARRRRLGRERALGARGGRGRARRQALRAWRSSAASRRASSRSSAARRTGAAPRCASSPTRRSSAPRPRSSRRAFSRWRARRPICFGGVEIRWSCDKALLAGVDDVPEQETFHFERGLTDFLDRRAARDDADPSRHLRRQGRQDRQPRRGRMGGRVGARTRTASSRPTATRSRRQTAARTRRACAPR